MKKARKEGFLHPAISSNITLAKEKERKNRKTEEEETGFFEEKTAMATLLLDYFEKKKCVAEDVYLQFGGKVFKKSSRSGAYH